MTFEGHITERFQNIASSRGNILLNKGRRHETIISAMARIITAAFLVLLIGNPFCCCAFITSSASKPSEVSLPPCCQATLDVAPASEEETPLSCPCQKSPGLISQSDVLLPVAQVMLPVSVVNSDESVILPSARELSPPHVLHPGRSGPLAATPPFHLLYGVFRC